jgi:hypothetical protein
MTSLSRMAVLLDLRRDVYSITSVVPAFAI